VDRALRLRRPVVAVLALGLGLGLTLPPARAFAAPAPTGSTPAERVVARLERGQALFVEQEYRAAIRVLWPVPRDAAATSAQRLRALELLGLSYLILGQEARARAAFAELLAIDPGYALRDDTGSPKIRRFFDRTKAEIVPGFDPAAAVELALSAPAGVTAGRRAEIAVRISATEAGSVGGASATEAGSVGGASGTEAGSVGGASGTEAGSVGGASGSGSAHVKEVVLRWRRRGVLAYQTARGRLASPAQGSTWRVGFVAPSAGRPYVLEYYAEARDLAGVALGRAGGPETPIALTVAPGERGARAWHGRWDVWAGAAAIVGTGAVLLLGGGEHAAPGSLPPGTVELTH
jgi:hypothetical protein